ncbi:Guanyl-specific ribonuclease F1 [Cryoendolithus antarcticus]|uniref:ribonuclease T1 n=1 Tax=Cryoendolithus antarcticus TaxID=1507870 RepID=A0A1V8TEX3_9PEZI|nr:Guanyl-specific ribonuclease F1 [Cryoendolithus antarcticus]
MYTCILAATFFVASTFAAPGPIGARQGAVTCGSTYYSATKVAAAVNQGCNYYTSGQQVGSGGYPHTYNNYEGFDFDVAGPYQEFPIKTSGTFTGGSPGADRVVFNRNCQYGGSITHTGASGNAFVGCSDTS